jgi:cell division protein FtsB
VSGKGASTIERPSTPPRASDRGRSRLGDITRPVQIDRRITKQRRSSLMLAIIALAIAGALAAALFGLPIQTYFNQDERLDQRRDQLAQLESVNDDLRNEVARLDTVDGVREAAREELGFVEAGEHRESILDFPAVPTDLPDGWPYSLVNDITELRRNPAPPPAPASQP